MGWSISRLNGDTVLLHKVIARLHGWIIEQFGHCATYKMSEWSTVCLSRWLFSLLGKDWSFRMQDTGTITRCSLQGLSGTSSGHQPRAWKTGIFSVVDWRDWSNSSIELRKATGRSVPGTETFGSAKPVEALDTHISLLHTNIPLTWHAYSVLSTSIQFSKLTEFEQD